MVLQDIKNKGAAGQSKKMDSGRNKTVSTIADPQVWNMPLLKRIQIALNKKQAQTSEDEGMDKEDMPDENNQMTSSSLTSQTNDSRPQPNEISMASDKDNVVLDITHSFIKNDEKEEKIEIDNEQQIAATLAEVDVSEEQNIASKTSSYSDCFLGDKAEIESSGIDPRRHVKEVDETGTDLLCVQTNHLPRTDEIVTERTTRRNRRKIQINPKTNFDWKNQPCDADRDFLTLIDEKEGSSDVKSSDTENCDTAGGHTLLSNLPVSEDQLMIADDMKKECCANVDTEDEKSGANVSALNEENHFSQVNTWNMEESSLKVNTRVRPCKKSRRRSMTLPSSVYKSSLSDVKDTNSSTGNISDAVSSEKCSQFETAEPQGLPLCEHIPSGSLNELRPPDSVMEADGGAVSVPLQCDEAVAEFLASEPCPEVPPKKTRKGRRRSADIDILLSNVILSPESKSSPDAELPQPSRRSRRLKRKSIEIYRANIQQQQEVDIVEEMEVEEGEKSEVAVDIGADIVSDTDITDQVCFDSSSTNSQPPEDTLIKENPDNSIDRDMSMTDTSGKESDTNDASKRSRRKKTTDSSLASASVAQAETDKRQNRKRKRQPSMEEIYLNKLWRTQMPKEKSWETIFEQPKISKSGKEDVQSVKKLKRFVNFENTWSTSRLKERRQKAKNRGWKPMSKKKDAQMEKLLSSKIDLLDLELEEASGEPGADTSLLPSGSTEFGKAVELEGMAGVEVGDDSVFGSVSECQDGPSMEEEQVKTEEAEGQSDQKLPPGVTPIKRTNLDPDFDDVFYTPAKTVTDLLKFTTPLEKQSSSYKPLPECGAVPSVSLTEDKSEVPFVDNAKTPEGKPYTYKELSPDF